MTLIGIEEPELTVHPGVLPMLYDFLIQASRRSQVLITTHSPDLLNHLARFWEGELPASPAEIPLGRSLALPGSRKAI